MPVQLLEETFLVDDFIYTFLYSPVPKFLFDCTVDFNYIPEYPLKKFPAGEWGYPITKIKDLHYRIHFYPSPILYPKYSNKKPLTSPTYSDIFFSQIWHKLVIKTVTNLGFESSKQYYNFKIVETSDERIFGKIICQYLKEAL